MIQNGNFSFRGTVETEEIKCQDDEIFDSCNFSQNAPGTKVLFSGKKITIRNSNCTNCVFEDGVTVEGSNTHQTEKPLDVLAEERRIEEEKNKPEPVYTETELKEVMVAAGVDQTTIEATLAVKGKNAGLVATAIEEEPIEEPIEELKGKV